MERIGPYQVEERIGVGGMGEVYKAYDDRLERWVAIKRIRGDKDESEENRERFQREARATAKLNHSSIVHLYDIFQDGDSDCIVMEYVEGVTLDSLIRNRPLEPLQAVSLGHEIASGLAEAHAKGIIHRDLKVENIIVTPEGHAKILDFGLARPFFKDELDASLTGKGQLVGTSRTMSPEYVGGEDIDHRSDLFSLGVLLYEAVTSHSPFKAHNTLATLKQVMLRRQTPAHLVNVRRVRRCFMSPSSVRWFIIVPTSPTVNFSTPYFVSLWLKHFILGGGFKAELRSPNVLFQTK